MADSSKAPEPTPQELQISTFVEYLMASLELTGPEKTIQEKVRAVHKAMTRTSLHFLQYISDESEGDKNG